MEHDKTRYNMTKRDGMLRNTTEHDETLWNMTEHEETLQNQTEPDGTQQLICPHMKIYQNLLRSNR